MTKDKKKALNFRRKKEPKRVFPRVKTSSAGKDHPS